MSHPYQLWRQVSGTILIDMNCKVTGTLIVPQPVGLNTEFGTAWRIDRRMPAGSISAMKMVLHHRIGASLKACPIMGHYRTFFSPDTWGALGMQSRP